jgi:hypothetical protein
MERPRDRLSQRFAQCHLELRQMLEEGLRE